jgi:hypothetical protein
MSDPSCFLSKFHRAKSRTDSDLENQLGGEIAQASHLRFFGQSPDRYGTWNCPYGRKIAPPDLIAKFPSSHLQDQVEYYG